MDRKLFSPSNIEVSAVNPCCASHAHWMPIRAACPAWNDLVIVPKLRRMPEAIDPLAFLREEPRRLFVLHREQELPNAPFAPPDILKELDEDPGLFELDGVIVSLITHWMELHRTHSFFFCCSANEIFEPGLGSLSYLTEELSDLHAWCRSERDRTFKIHIYSQGAELLIDLSSEGDVISHDCSTNPWRNPEYFKGDWTNTGESLAQNCRAIAEEFANVARHLGLADIPSFQAWLRSCGASE